MMQEVPIDHVTNDLKDTKSVPFTNTAQYCYYHSYNRTKNSSGGFDCTILRSSNFLPFSPTVCSQCFEDSVSNAYELVTPLVRLVELSQAINCQSAPFYEVNKAVFYPYYPSLSLGNPKGTGSNLSSAFSSNKYITYLLRSLVVRELQRRHHSLHMPCFNIIDASVHPNEQRIKDKVLLALDDVFLLEEALIKRADSDRASANTSVECAIDDLKKMLEEPIDVKFFPSMVANAKGAPSVVSAKSANGVAHHEDIKDTNGCMESVTKLGYLNSTEWVTNDENCGISVPLINGNYATSLASFTLAERFALFDPRGGVHKYTGNPYRTLNASATAMDLCNSTLHSSVNDTKLERITDSKSSLLATSFKLPESNGQRLLGGNGVDGLCEEGREEVSPPGLLQVKPNGSFTLQCGSIEKPLTDPDPSLLLSSSSTSHEPSFLCLDKPVHRPVKRALPDKALSEPRIKKRVLGSGIVAPPNSPTFRSAASFVRMRGGEEEASETILNIVVATTDMRDHEGASNPHLVSTGDWVLLPFVYNHRNCSYEIRLKSLLNPTWVKTKRFSCLRHGHKNACLLAERYRSLFRHQYGSLRPTPAFAAVANEPPSLLPDSLKSASIGFREIRRNRVLAERMEPVHTYFEVLSEAGEDWEVAPHKEAALVSLVDSQPAGGVNVSDREASIRDSDIVEDDGCPRDMSFDSMPLETREALECVSDNTDVLSFRRDEDGHSAMDRTISQGEVETGDPEVTHVRSFVNRVSLKLKRDLFRRWWYDLATGEEPAKPTVSLNSEHHPSVVFMAKPGLSVVKANEDAAFFARSRSVESMNTAYFESYGRSGWPSRDLKDHGYLLDPPKNPYERPPSIGADATTFPSLSSNGERWSFEEALGHKDPPGSGHRVTDPNAPKFGPDAARSLLLRGGLVAAAATDRLQDSVDYEAPEHSTLERRKRKELRFDQYDDEHESWTGNYESLRVLCDPQHRNGSIGYGVGNTESNARSGMKKREASRRGMPQTRELYGDKSLGASICFDGENRSGQPQRVGIRFKLEALPLSKEPSIRLAALRTPGFIDIERCSTGNPSVFDYELLYDSYENWENAKTILGGNVSPIDRSLEEDNPASRRLMKLLFAHFLDPRVNDNGQIIRRPIINIASYPGLYLKLSLLPSWEARYLLFLKFLLVQQETGEDTSTIEGQYLERLMIDFAKPLRRVVQLLTVETPAVILPELTNTQKFNQSVIAAHNQESEKDLPDGVVFDRSNTAWRAFWREGPNNKSKGYSSRKYGYAQAKVLAIEARILAEFRWLQPPTRGRRRSAIHCLLMGMLESPKSLRGIWEYMGGRERTEVLTEEETYFADDFAGVREQHSLIEESTKDFDRRLVVKQGVLRVRHCDETVSRVACERYDKGDTATAESGAVGGASGGTITGGDRVSEEEGCFTSLGACDAASMCATGYDEGIGHLEAIANLQVVGLEPEGGGLHNREAIQGSTVGVSPEACHGIPQGGESVLDEPQEAFSLTVEQTVVSKEAAAVSGGPCTESPIEGLLKREAVVEGDHNDARFPLRDRLVPSPDKGTERLLLDGSLSTLPQSDSPSLPHPQSRRVATVTVKQAPTILTRGKRLRSAAEAVSSLVLRGRAVTRPFVLPIVPPHRSLSRSTVLNVSPKTVGIVKQSTAAEDTKPSSAAVEEAKLPAHLPLLKEGLQELQKRLVWEEYSHRWRISVEANQLSVWPFSLTRQRKYFLARSSRLGDKQSAYRHALNWMRRRIVKQSVKPKRSSQRMASDTVSPLLPEVAQINDVEGTQSSLLSTTSVNETFGAAKQEDPLNANSESFQRAESFVSTSHSLEILGERAVASSPDALTSMSAISLLSVDDEVVPHSASPATRKGAANVESVDSSASTVATRKSLRLMYASPVARVDDKSVGSHTLIEANASKAIGQSRRNNTTRCQKGDSQIIQSRPNLDASKSVVKDLGRPGLRRVVLSNHSTPYSAYDDSTKKHKVFIKQMNTEKKVIKKAIVDPLAAVKNSVHRVQCSRKANELQKKHTDVSSKGIIPTHVVKKKKNSKDSNLGDVRRVSKSIIKTEAVKKPQKKEITESKVIFVEKKRKLISRPKKRQLKPKPFRKG